MGRNDVVWAYRIFLGREPESDEVINSFLNSVKSRREMVKAIMESKEFSEKHITS